MDKALLTFRMGDPMPVVIQLTHTSGPVVPSGTRQISLEVRLHESGKPEFVAPLQARGAYLTADLLPGKLSPGPYFLGLLIADTVGGQVVSRRYGVCSIRVYPAGSLYNASQTDYLPLQVAITENNAALSLSLGNFPVVVTGEPTTGLEFVLAGQTSATLTHNLGRIPRVTVVDSTGKQIGVAIEHLFTTPGSRITNQCIISSNQPITGTAIFHQ